MLIGGSGWVTGSRGGQAVGRDVGGGDGVEDVYEVPGWRRRRGDGRFDGNG